MFGKSSKDKRSVEGRRRAGTRPPSQRRCVSRNIGDSQSVAANQLQRTRGMSSSNSKRTTQLREQRLIRLCVTTVMASPSATHMPLDKIATKRTSSFARKQPRNGQSRMFPTILSDPHCATNKFVRVCCRFWLRFAPHECREFPLLRAHARNEVDIRERRAERRNCRTD
jgi:hypothetical protein